MAEELKKLLAILTRAVDTIVDVCERRKQDFPSLDQPVQQSEYGRQGIRNDPAVADAIKFGVAAAKQLQVTLQSPIQTVVEIGWKAMVAGSVCAVERSHVAEVLRIAGDKGMHVSEIVKYNGSNTDKLARILRQLSTYHIFKEVSPDVFAHNMLSSVLDTGKSIDEIMSSPDAKFDDTDGIAALTSMVTDEVVKASTYLPECMTDPNFVHSEEPNMTSAQKAFRTTETYWAFLEHPENAFRLHRFARAMKGIHAMQQSGTITTCYDWSSLPSGATVVDVGSGLGHVSLGISTVRPDLTFVLEDRPPVMEDAKEHWQRQAPNLMNNVHFVGLDYLQPQPPLPSAPDVFLVRHVIHSVSDKYAIILLKHLRAAAKPSTILLAIDYVVQYACRLPNDSSYKLRGYEPIVAPPPLLPNFGYSGTLPYDMDMVMLNWFNAKERTIADWRRLFAESGWRLVTVREPEATDAAGWPTIVAELAT